MIFNILTGSNQLDLIKDVTQSLAGRVAMVHLLPFSLEEAYGQRLQQQTIDSVLYTGFYPRIFNKNLDPTHAMRNYVETYLNKDVRNLINIKDLSAFERFLKICAGRTGQILNWASIGRACDVGDKTMRHWVSILRASYVIEELRPFYKNYNKRLIKSSKLYFLDTGLACFLLGIQNKRHLYSHPLKGALFETLVVSEMWKGLFNAGKINNLYYFRDSKGHEIDLICDNGIGQTQIEIKSSQTISQRSFKGLNYYKKIAGNIDKSILIYGGDENYFRNNTHVIGWKNIPQVYQNTKNDEPGNDDNPSMR